MHLFFLIGPSALVLDDDKKQKQSTSTIVNIAADETVDDNCEFEKCYQ